MENSDILQNCGLFLPGKEVLMRVCLCVCMCVYVCGGEGTEMERLNIILLRNIKKFNTEESLNKATPAIQLFVMRCLNRGNLKD